MHEKILTEVEKLENQIVNTLIRLCSIPAVSPHNGGEGEDKKIQELEKIIHELGLADKAKIKYEYVDDDKAPSGKRPSLFLEYPGKKSQRLCILSHVDVVPGGNLKPFVQGSKLYGRGVCDNGAGLVPSLFALKALLNAGLESEYTVLLAFVADEETGSHYGLEKLIERDLFRPDDLVLVPDWGNEKGDFIEIAEKSVLRLHFKVTGKQVHAAYPNRGLNACRVANILACEVDEALHKAFIEENKIFEPPFSTFEPTRRFANVPNVNTVPGEENFSFDCRVLPEISLDEVQDLVEKICKEIETSLDGWGSKIELQVEKSPAPAPTSPDSEVTRLLIKNIREVLKLEPFLGGVGGGTLAAFFRQKNIPAVVWSQVSEDSMHQPDEFIEIKFLVNNAKVFALMMAEAI